MLWIAIFGVLNSILVYKVLINRQRDAFNHEGLMNYAILALTPYQIVRYMLIHACLGGFVGYVFYRSVEMVLLVGLIWMWAILPKRETMIAKRQSHLTLQFKDAIYILSTSLTVGKSLNNAIIESKNELEKIYLGSSAYMVRELEVMRAKLEMNASVESVFNDFALRSHSEDIQNFSNVLSIGRKRGANIVELIRKTSQVIGDKIQVQKDIETVLTAKRYELRVLTVMPVFFIAFITKSSPELMEPVYTEFIGRIVMSCALAMFGTAYLIGEKLIKIEV